MVSAALADVTRAHQRVVSLAERGPPRRRRVYAAPRWTRVQANGCTFPRQRLAAPASTVVRARRTKAGAAPCWRPRARGTDRLSQRVDALRPVLRTLDEVCLERRCEAREQAHSICVRASTISHRCGKKRCSSDGQDVPRDGPRRCPCMCCAHRAGPGALRGDCALPQGQAPWAERAQNRRFMPFSAATRYASAMVG